MSYKFFFKNIIQKFLKLFNYKLINIIDSELDNTSSYNKKLIKTFSKFTMTSDNKIFTLIKAVEYVKKYNIEGDFVESGVFTGGNIMLFEELISNYNLKKKIFAYDTFTGMVEPTVHDEKIDGTIALEKYFNSKEWVKCSKENVVKNFKKKNLSVENVNFVEGMVQETLKIQENLPKKISILRLDTDFYESTKAELEYLYPLLSDKGILIIDDYGAWKGSKKAVDEYFFNKKIWLHYIDHSARILIK